MAKGTLKKLSLDASVFQNVLNTSASSPTSSPSQPSSTQALTRKRTLDDFFCKPGQKINANSDQEDDNMDSQVTDTVPSSPVDRGPPTSSPASTPEPSTALKLPEKLVITARNGYKGSLASSSHQQHTRKRIKRESTLEDVDSNEVGNTQNLKRVASMRTLAKLSLLPSLPLDILFEAFSHLPPISLLHLSRTSKRLRGLLLHRSSTTVWKASIASMPDLPQAGCPDDVDLPQWASLVWEVVCQNCLAPNTRSVDFLLRVRYCGHCAKVLLIPQKKFAPKLNTLHSLFLKYLPFSDWNKRGVLCCTVDAKVAFIREMVERGVFEDGSGDPESFFEEKMAQLEKRKRHADSWTSWLRRQTDAREKELDVIKKTRKALIRKNLTDLGYGEELTYLDRMDHGYCAVLPWPKIEMFKDLVDVKQPKALTDRAWNKMKPAMMEYMDSARGIRMQANRVLILRARRHVIQEAYLDFRRCPSNLVLYPASRLMPNPADIFEWEPMQQLINRRDDEPLTKSQVVDAFNDIFDPLSDYIARWQRVSVAVLTDMLPHKWNFPDNYMNRRNGNEVLQLAITVFRCKDNRTPHYQVERNWYRDEGILHGGNQYDERTREERKEWVMWFPEHMFHTCTSVVYVPFAEERAGAHKHLSVDGEMKGCRRREWGVGCLEFDEKASRCVEGLLKAAGMKKMETTVAEMDKGDGRFVCLKCTFGNRCDGQRKVRVFAWRDAVQHCLKVHFGDSRVTWELISPEDTVVAKALEATERGNPARHYPGFGKEKKWKCLLCRDTKWEKGRMSASALKRHYRDMRGHEWHKVDIDDFKAQEGKLFYRALDYAPRPQPHVELVPRTVEVEAKGVDERGEDNSSSDED